MKTLKFIVFGILIFISLNCNKENPVDPVVGIENPSPYKGTIRGSVYDVVTNSPIMDVQAYSDFIADSSFTDINGEFVFQNFEMPDSVYEYVIFFDHDMYESGSVAVTARNGQEVMTEIVYLTPVEVKK